MCICGTDRCEPHCQLCPVHGRNDRESLIEGISKRLREAYAAEMIALVLGYYDVSHWYNAKREGLHKDLKILLNVA